jgi:GT2 family glycosyltransferase
MSKCHIIIVNYNAGSWLLRSLKSAVHHSNANVSVVDNDSSDNSVSLAKNELKANPRVSWVLNSENRGFAAANNMVLKQLLESNAGALANAYAILMNPDCELNQDTVPKIIAQFDANPKLGIASCKIFNQDGSIQVTSKRRFPTPWSALVRMSQLHRIFPNNALFANFDYGDSSADSEVLEFVEAISGAFMVARLSAVQEVGLLDEGYFMHCEDLDWCKRFAQHGWQVGSVAEASVIHAKGVSRQSRPVAVLWTLHKGMNRFFDKFYYQQYSWATRWLVKGGIYSSFVLRAVLAIAKSLGRKQK